MIKLNDGSEIPVVGFGAGERILPSASGQAILTSGTALYGKESVAIIKQALATGYKYLDAAQQYGNSESIGLAVENREDVYIVTKCTAIKGCC